MKAPYCASARRDVSSRDSAPSTPTWWPDLAARGGLNCERRCDLKARCIAAATRRTFWSSAASGRRWCASEQTCGRVSVGLLKRRRVGRPRRRNRPVETRVAAAEPTVDRERADARVLWSDAIHSLPQIVDLHVLDGRRAHHTLYDVATLEQPPVPTGWVDVFAKHHRITFAAVDVLEHARR